MHKITTIIKAKEKEFDRAKENSARLDNGEVLNGCGGDILTINNFDLNQTILAILKEEIKILEGRKDDIEDTVEPCKDFAIHKNEILEELIQDKLQVIKELS